MLIYYSNYYVIRVGWSLLHPGHPGVPETTRPDYILFTRQTDYHSVTSRTNKSPRLLKNNTATLSDAATLP